MWILLSNNIKITYYELFFLKFIPNMKDESLKLIVIKNDYDIVIYIRMTFFNLGVLIKNYP